MDRVRWHCNGSRQVWPSPSVGQSGLITRKPPELLWTGCAKEATNATDWPTGSQDETAWGGLADR